MAVLPKPSELKKTSKASASDHAVARILKLSQEENKLVRSLNRLRSEHESLGNTLEASRAELLEAHEMFVGSLRNEVSNLESRKREALSEIIDRTPEFEKREQELKEREHDVVTSESRLHKYQVDLEELSKIVRSEEVNLIRATERLVDQQIRTQTALDKLRNERAKLDEDIKRHQRNIATEKVKMKARENDIALAERTLKVREESLQKLGKDLHDRRRAVEDGYHNLMKAIAEKGNKKRKSV